MRLLIDLQACQSTGSKTRGIGRYSMELAKAMVRQAQHHDIHLLLNAAFPDAVTEIRKVFETHLPQENFHLWHGLYPSNELDPRNAWRLRANELIREQVIREIRPDVLHITSLFEGLNDDAIVSVPVLSDSEVPVAVTLYDLIPLINASTYLQNDQVRSWYYRKAQSLKRADLLLSISESSRQEGIDFLFFPEERIVNISSAVDERFDLRSAPHEEILEVRHRYGLDRDFVMYTGGIDLRKNIEGLMQAYSRMPEALRKAHQLAIVCSVHEHDRVRLEALARSLGLQATEFVLTGFVPDQDLPKLYHSCKLFVFPSWHEGFGLPALEAMSCGAPVIAANTSSLPEVIGWSNAMFDPYDIDAITSKLSQVLMDADFRQELIKHGIEQAKKFSWDASGKRALTALETLVSAKQAKQVSVCAKTVGVRPKLAYISPVPPAQSGIADYSAELLPELAAHFDIEIVSDRHDCTEAWLAANFKMRSIEWFVEHADRFDRILYNFGNSMFHEYMLDLLEQFPGVVVLHDFYHSGLISHLDMTGRRPGIWDSFLFQSHGYAPLYKKAKTADVSNIIWQYPCNQFVLDRALGIIVHSGFSTSLARDWYGPGAANEWKLIQHLRVLPKRIDRVSARRQLGLQEDELLICSFGILGPTKLNHELLDACIQSGLFESLNCRLVFVGKNDGGDYGLELLAKIKDAGIEGRVTITGFAEVEVFRRYLQAADIAVQLRGLSRGETSGTVLDCMAYGVPTIINKNGAMAELPSGPLVQLEENFDVPSLSRELQRLANDSRLRQEYGERARTHIREKHGPNMIGQHYHAAIEDFYRKGAACTLRKTIDRIAELDYAFEAQDAIQLAGVLERNRITSLRARLLIDCSSLGKVKETDVIRSILDELVENLPQYVQIVPVVWRENYFRIAAKEFEKLLAFSTNAATQVDLQPINLTRSDVLIHFRLNQQPDTDGISQAILSEVTLANARQILLDLTEPNGKSEPHDKFIDKVLASFR